MKYDNLKKELRKEMESMRVVDCHSHTLAKTEYYENAPYDLFTLESYFRRDISSTLGRNLYRGAATDDERWRRLKKALQKAGNVCYWRHNLQVYKKLFDLAGEEITDENWEAVNNAIKEKTKDPGWYDHVTEDICQLETQVRNVSWFEDWDDRYFKAVLRMEPVLYIHKEEIKNALEDRVNVEIKSLDTLKQAVNKLVREYTERGAVGIKLAHAYLRTLAMEKVTEKEASACFERIMPRKTPALRDLKLLQDHLIYFLGEVALEHGLIFQIHTGIQDNWCAVQYSDPLHLSDLLKSFPNVCFDLLHAGYPYARHMGILAKHYPNVWVNMAWVYLISTAAGKQVLSEYLDLVPVYRLLAFGSDVDFPEMILGHLLMACGCVVDVLAEKVGTGVLSEELAPVLLKMMFRDNALTLYDKKAVIASRPEDQNYHWFQVAGKHIYP